MQVCYRWRGRCGSQCYRADPVLTWILIILSPPNNAVTYCGGLLLLSFGGLGASSGSEGGSVLVVPFVLLWELCSWHWLLHCQPRSLQPGCSSTGLWFQKAGTGPAQARGTPSTATSSHVKRSTAVLKMLEKIPVAAPCSIYRILCSTGYWGSYHLLTSLYEKGLEMQIASNSSSWKSRGFFWAINTVLDRGLSALG